jgi:hypothetical protein
MSDVRSFAVVIDEPPHLFEVDFHGAPSASGQCTHPARAARRRPGAIIIERAIGEEPRHG